MEPWTASPDGWTAALPAGWTLPATRALRCLRQSPFVVLPLASSREPYDDVIYRWQGRALMHDTLPRELELRRVAGEARDRDVLSIGASLCCIGGVLDKHASVRVRDLRNAHAAASAARHTLRVRAEMAAQRARRQTKKKSRFPGPHRGNASLL